MESFCTEPTDIIIDETEEEKKENVEPSQRGDSAEEGGRRDSMK